MPRPPLTTRSPATVEAVSSQAAPKLKGHAIYSTPRRKFCMEGMCFQHVCSMSKQQIGDWGFGFGFGFRLKIGMGGITATFDRENGN